MEESFPHNRKLSRTGSGIRKTHPAGIFRTTFSGVKYNLTFPTFKQKPKKFFERTCKKDAGFLLERRFSPQITGANASIGRYVLPNKKGIANFL
jgi:hypothetical protein